MRPRVAVVGSCNIDLIVKLPKLPARGETVLGGEFIRVFGGKGANQAVAAAKLGADVVFIAKIGNDEFGRGYLENLRENGVNVEYVFIDPEKPTGVALIFVEEGGGNMIGVAPGANSFLSPVEVENAHDAIVKSDVLLVQLEVPLETVEKAIDIARSEGVKVILNPAPVPPDGLDDDLLSKVDVLTPNEIEASGLSGIQIGDLKDVEQAARKLLKRGVGSVVITLGEMGAVVADDEGFERFPPPKVEPLDTTAAGDVFNGALARALAAGARLREAVQFANKAAAISVTRIGAQPSIPSLEEVENYED